MNTFFPSGCVFLLFWSLVGAQRIINESYKRSIYFTGPIVREEHLIQVSVEDESSKPSSSIPEELAAEIHANWFPNYVFLVPTSQTRDISSWSASVIEDPSEARTSSLDVSEITDELASCKKYGYRCLNIALPMEGRLQQQFLIAVSLSFVNELTPKPMVQKNIAAPIKLLYRSESLDAISAYETRSSQTVLGISSSSKSLKMRCPTGRKPQKLENAAMPMGMKGFVCQGSGPSNGPVEFHYEAKDSVMLKVKKLHRKFTYLPWSGEFQVAESYEFVHEGFRPPESPSFSRIEFHHALQRARGNLMGLQIVPRVLVIVPHEARMLQVRDEVGINWGELERSSVEANSDVVQIPLRSPLVGGMSAAFDFYYTIRSSSLIRPFKSQSSPFKKLIQMQMFQMSLDVAVEEFKLTFVLPEDSADIEYELATKQPVRVVKRTYRSFFSSIGEKEISFEFSQLTREDLEKEIAILFNFPFWGVFRKPLVALSSLVLLVIGLLYLNRLDLSIRSGKGIGKKSAKEGIRVLKSLFEKRREVLMNFEDLIASNLNTRATTEQVENDRLFRAQLDQQLEDLQNAIFERIKNSPLIAEDQQKSSLAAMALKRLYDEQNGTCRKILGQVVCAESSKNSCSIDSLKSQSGTFVSSRNSSCATVSKMSQSGSEDLLTPKSEFGKEIESLAKQAQVIDAQVSQYESKFCH
jgi:hypothetical protein